LTISLATHTGTEAARFLYSWHTRIYKHNLYHVRGWDFTSKIRFSS